MKPRALCGFGMVSALGVGREPFLRAMADGDGLAQRLGRTAHAPITSFDASAYPDASVTEVPSFDPSRYLGEKGLRTLDRLTKLLLVAAKLAMHDGGLKRDGVFVQSSPERVGVVCSNAYGSLEAIAELDRVAVLEDARYINPAKFPNTVSNSASGYVSIWEDLRALNVAVSDGNCGALDAVACADIYLETGRADVLLVGGAEALSEGLYMAFRRLGALEGGALGEGAALFVMEPREHAAARGASPSAEVIGYGTAFVPPAGEASLFHASAEAMERAIVNALSDAEDRREGGGRRRVQRVRHQRVRHGGARGDPEGARSGRRRRGSEGAVRRDARRRRGDGHGRRARVDAQCPSDADRARRAPSGRRHRPRDVDGILWKRVGRGDAPAVGAGRTAETLMNAKPSPQSAPNWVDLKARADVELARVHEAREKQVYPYFRQFETGGLHTTIAGKPIIKFSSNDYLGLTNHPKVKEAARKSLDRYACGLSSSRVQATTVEHVELERVSRASSATRSASSSRRATRR